MSRPTETRLPILKSAFTLIELLVVIAIIAILASMLLPALARAKDKSQNTVDFNNVRQIMLASHLYTNDNQEYLPHPSWGGVASGNPGPDNWLYAGYVNRQVIPNGAGTADNKPQIPYYKAGQLAVFLGPNINIVFCPKDKVEIGGSKKALWMQREMKLSSYTWNGCISGLTSQLAGGRTFKITEFKPTNIVQWEADEMTPFFFNDAGNQPHEGISQRHSSAKTVSTATDVGGSAAMGMMSGSAQNVKYKKFYDLAGGVGKAFRPQDLPNDLYYVPSSTTGGY